MEEPPAYLVIIFWTIYDLTPTFMMGQAKNNMRLHSEMKNI